MKRTEPMVVYSSCVLLVQSTLSLVLLFSFAQSGIAASGTRGAIELPSSATTATTTHIVTDFGAIGDGRRYDTTSIQSAIDACPPSSISCHVVFPANNTYLTATIYLKSGVILVIEEGAVLLGGTKIEDYPAESSRWYVVLAEQAVNVGIRGGGEINGQGLKFVERFDKRKNVMISWNKTGACYGDECRPRLVGFIGCLNVSVADVKLNQPAYWWSVFYLPLICSCLIYFLLSVVTIIFCVGECLWCWGGFLG